ncbi:MAG: hypothetical protein Q6363_009765 [Candidatus Njordarchaeota archaeon]
MKLSEFMKNVAKLWFLHQVQEGVLQDLYSHEYAYFIAMWFTQKDDIERYIRELEKKYEPEVIYGWLYFAYYILSYSRKDLIKTIDDYIELIEKASTKYEKQRYIDIVNHSKDVLGRVNKALTNLREILKTTQI